MITKGERCVLCCVLVLLSFQWINAFTDDLQNNENTRTKRQESPECQPTETITRDGTACGGQTIFEEDFNTLREEVWQVEQYIPVTSHPEKPFVSYQKDISVVYVSDGLLHIAPKIQETMPSFTSDFIPLGTLDLFNGCTSQAEECYQQASGADILPPVVSGRLKSKFSFTYGTIHIRAKLPQGDWLYPELLLEPFYKKYGFSNFASGVMKIAAARGNKELRVGLEEYGNQVLFGGPVMNLNCRDQLIKNSTLEDSQWGDQFHNYSLTWTPDYISLSVDGEEWGSVSEPMQLHRGFHYSYCTGLPRNRLYKGNKMAPFDVDFYITLGVAAGGVTEFPDDSYTGGGRPKPWRNSARKAMLGFWEDKSAWESTWTQPELIVDHIKVVAL